MRPLRLDDLLGYQLRRASAAMIADFAPDLAGIGLTVAGMSVLVTADEPGGRTQSDIGRMLGIARANMAPLAAALVDQGLIERVAVDGRSHALMLTHAGRLRLAQARDLVLRHEARFLPDLSADARQALLETLRAIWLREARCEPDVLPNDV